MTYRTQLASFFVLLFAALAFFLVAQMTGGLVWRGQVAIGSNPVAEASSQS